MLIAEALAERKDLLARISEWPGRFTDAVTWDEDEDRPADGVVDQVEDELVNAIKRLSELNVAIHRANNTVTLNTEEGHMTIMEAIALRDRWNLEHKMVGAARERIEERLGRSQRRYGFERRSKDDVKSHSLSSPTLLRAWEDDLAGKIRRLDLAVQAVNWSESI